MKTRRLTTVGISLIFLAIIVGGIATASENKQTTPYLAINNVQNGQWVNSRWFPNGTVYYEVQNTVTGEIAASGQFEVNNAPLSAVPDTGDPYVIRRTLDNRYVSEIYENQISLQIEYREYDLQDPNGTITVLRPATNQEILDYNINKLSQQQESSITQAKQGLQASPENGGSNYETWVTDRVADLQSCETDMITGQGQQFTSLGVNGQNQTINRLEQCIQLNSRIHRQVISNLYDLLVAEGIITP